MPTVILINGWRFFFYSNEQNEPIHIHCKKVESECKYWIKENEFEIELAFSFNMNPRDFRDVRRIIFQNFDHIISEWKKCKKGERK
jgi:hypothetical protein